MKGAMKSVSDKLQLRKRAIIETINDEKDLLCKNHLQSYSDRMMIAGDFC